MPTSSFTVDELVATLRKTTLPTILVEGTGDARIYRKLEEEVGSSIGSVLSCGGRTTLLEVYMRRHEFSHLPVAFVADRDMWAFQTIPAEYSDVVWTIGYSIENDAYHGSVVEGLLDQAEKAKFNALLDEVCQWFSFEIEEFLAGRTTNVAAGIGLILNNTRSAIRPEFLTQRGYRLPDVHLFRGIRSSYSIKLRGKTLISLLASVLSDPKRQAKFSKSALVEICVSMDRNPDCLRTLITGITEKLNPQPNLPL